MTKQQRTEFNTYLKELPYWSRLTIETCIDQGVLTKSQALEEILNGEWG